MFIPRFASRSSKSGNQYTVEEIAQGKHQIEQLYEFEKLEINSQPSTRDERRHHINRVFPFGFGFRKKMFVLGGKKGVFDLEDILQILRDERMRDICVIEVPPE